MAKKLYIISEKATECYHQFVTQLNDKTVHYIDTSSFDTHRKIVLSTDYNHPIATIYVPYNMMVRIEEV